MSTVRSRFTTDRVPELSLADYLTGSPEAGQQFIDDLFHGLKYHGFIILKDHPIDEDLLAHAYDLSERLFQLPEERKLKYTGREGGGQRGYTAFGKEHAKDSKFPDLKEFWHVGRELAPDSRLRGQFPENVWPAEFADFKATFLKIYESLDAIGRIILRALTGPLDVPPGYFERMVTRGNSILRLLHYPPVPEGADPNCVRAAAHEDINLITILVSASASGLQLKTREGKWLPIETAANNLIVDSGDMLARITNEVIPATTHRVVNPEGPNTHRYSMPFFMHPNSDAVLTCIPSCRGDGAKYPDILADDFLKQRLEEIGLTK
jgi:isopenicillin N synthase-like dioxygenase